MDGGSGSMIGGTNSGRKTAGADGNVVLNLASVPLQQAAKTVLGDMIGVNYVVDPRVDGVISVQTTRPVSKAEAMEMFQTALVPIGAVLDAGAGFNPEIHILPYALDALGWHVIAVDANAAGLEMPPRHHITRAHDDICTLSHAQNRRRPDRSGKLIAAVHGYFTLPPAG